MTLGNLKTSLKYLLGDPLEKRFSDADKGQILNDASRLVTALCPSSILWSLIKKGTGTTDASGQVVLPADLGRVISLTWDAKPARLRRIVSKTNTITDGTATDPVWYYQDGKFTFQPNTTTKAVEIFYLHPEVTMASDSTECPLPDGLHPAVLEYAGFLGFASVKETNEAMLHYQQTIAIIRNLVEDGNNGTGSY